MKEKVKKAVALKYSGDEAAAPSVVAKGSSLVADNIIAIARRHGVPVRGDRHLVEILSTLDLYDEIPQELYKAVAEVLVFIYKVSGKL